MPPSSTPRIATIAVRVRCAFATTGSRKALTPLLTASTPVIAVQPLAKARSRSHRPAASVATGRAGGGTFARLVVDDKVERAPILAVLRQHPKENVLTPPPPLAGETPVYIFTALLFP